METIVLNYRIIIEPETDAKTGKVVYTALAPKIGVADWGNSVEQALSRIKEAIECHIESLLKHNKAIPREDGSDFMVATTSVTLPKNIKPSFV